MYGVWKTKLMTGFQTGAKEAMAESGAREGNDLDMYDGTLAAL